VAALGLGWILLPLYGTLMWGAIIALLFTPMYRWLQRQLAPRFGSQHTASALLTLGVVLVVVILPFAAISAALAGEAAGLYQRVQSGELNPAQFLRTSFDGLPGWARSGLGRLGLADFDTVQTSLMKALAQGSQVIAGQAFNLGQNTFEFAASVGVTLYLAFFLIRDGQSLVHNLQRGLPLTRGHQQALITQFSTVIRATVKGNLLVAAIQGALGGLAFWFLGIGGALLWAVLMAFLSLLPAVGAALVWLPVAAWLLMTGSLWQGLALIGWGVGVIGLVDNLLRPVLVGRDTRMPDYVVMVTTLGGMAVFGINGFVLGPVIAAMFMAVWRIHAAAR